MLALRELEAFGAHAMRFLAVLVAALAGLFLFAALDREAGRGDWLYAAISSAREPGPCAYFGQCGPGRRGLDRAEARGRVLETLTDRPDFLTPHHPAPSAHRRAAAQSILDCSVDAFDASTRSTARTREGLRWVAGIGRTPSDALVDRAEAGDPDAQLDLALGYLQRGSAEEAVEWVRRAAESGDPEAMAVLALALREPPVDAATLAEARAWNERAVAAAHPEALAAQALVFLEPEDDPAAFQARQLDLLLDAARLCHEPAALMIADRLMSAGRGFAADPGLADAILHRVTGDAVFAPE
jgi:hypothetical protein